MYSFLYNKTALLKDNNMNREKAEATEFKTLLDDAQQLSYEIRARQTLRPYPNAICEQVLVPPFHPYSFYTKQYRN